MAGNIVGGGAINATGTAAAISAPLATGRGSVLVQCHSSSASSLLVGWGSGQFIEIEPGEEMAFAVSDASSLYVKAEGDAATGGWLALQGA